jgi:preprotein translocase subunit SecG
MYTLLVILFIFACVIMVVSILLQSSKGGGLAGAFGGVAGSGTFGPRGAASLLQRVTIILAILYGLLCIFINLWGTSTQIQESILQRELNQDQIERTLPEAPLPLPENEPEPSQDE